MVILGELTELQAQELTGQLYAPDLYFNPIQVEGVWYISIEEMQGCVNPIFDWVKTLPIKMVEIPIPIENK
jgi:hypothetical protein